MARQGKYEDEKNRLNLVRKRLDETIEETESKQCSCGAGKEYYRALIYQEFARMLKEIKIVCGEEKPKEVKGGA